MLGEDLIKKSESKSSAITNATVMKTQKTIEDLRQFRPVLKRTKVMGRALEMAMDQALGNVAGPKVQFIRDIQLYGLWEALMYLESYHGTETIQPVIEEVIEELHRSGR